MNNWPSNPSRDFTIKNCKFIYNGWGITFGGTGLWNYRIDFTQIVSILNVDDSSSIHIDNRKHNFLVLSEGLADDVNNNLGRAEKKNSINFTKAIASCFFLSLHHNGDKSCLCVKKRQLQI